MTADAEGAATCRTLWILVVGTATTQAYLIIVLRMPKV